MSHMFITFSFGTFFTGSFLKCHFLHFKSACIILFENYLKIILEKKYILYYNCCLWIDVSQNFNFLLNFHTYKYFKNKLKIKLIDKFN